MEQADGQLELPRLTVLDLDGDGQMEAVVKEYRRGVEDTGLAHWCWTCSTARFTPMI